VYTVLVTPEQKARFRQILDSYDQAIATVNTSDENTVDILIRCAEVVATTQAIIENARHTLSNNKIIMDANRRANEQVRILLNDLA
jgi:ABC-type transporter Mla subunit MlaD